MVTTAENKKLYVPSVPIPPGETLLEVLEERGMTQAELARRLNRPIKTINEIVKGKAAITPETALQLEQVLDIQAHFWNNLETLYQDLKSRLEMEKQYRSQIDEASLYPYREMAKWGWVPETRDPTEKVKNLLSFFAVTSLQNIIEGQQLKGAFRISRKHKYSLPSIAAWLRRGVIDSETIQIKDYHRETLKNSLKMIRSLTQSNDPRTFFPKLRDVLADCGIAFVVTPSLPNAPINGSARWIKPNKALIQLSLRYKFSDIFWFSLFHEIGHILLERKRDFIVDFVNTSMEEETERKADQFAQETLIPPTMYQHLVDRIGNTKNYADIYRIIESFARQIEIHPGIVTGRLQYDRLLAMNMNKLRTRFEWTRSESI